MSQVVQLHPALQPRDIGLGDRGFCSYAHLALLSLKGIFGVFRIHQRKKVEFSFEGNRPVNPVFWPNPGRHG
jgi:hypothetical protein